MIGKRLGPYEVLAKLGEGGMGEVYRATDTNLKRQVAIKVLPDAVAADPERLARFQREAEVLAALNHPNIAQIYGLERADGQVALVMELVEGPTLAEVIGRGVGLEAWGLGTSHAARPTPQAGHPQGLSVSDALAIARQIAEALEAAHGQGIIHRDLKPANIKIREDGTVKVLDFGLAKAMGPEGVGAATDLSMSPTITTPAMTQMGMILGTAAYMSPEQAKGRPVDKRADIWAFGAVLYEMLAGTRAFEGDDASDTLAAVLRADLRLDALPRDIPARVRRVVAACLQRDPRQRVHDIADVRLALEGAFETTAPQTADTADGTQPVWRRPLPVAAAALAAGCLAVGLVAWILWPTAEAPRVRRLTIAQSDGRPLDLHPFQPVLALSPDGARAVYRVSVGGQFALVVRSLAARDTMVLHPGDAATPFFSPDGDWVGFFDLTDATLKRVSVTGGSPLPIVRVSGGLRGAAWSEDDTIVFGTDRPDGLWRVPVGGGTPEPLTTLDESSAEASHQWPELLPGGKAVLFTILHDDDADDGGQIVVRDLVSGRQDVLVSGGTYPRYAPTGHIVYVAAGGLRAVPFDLDGLQATGNPVGVIEGVGALESSGANVALAHDGSLVYATGGTTSIRRTLVWVDRDGRETAINAPPRGYLYPRLSPDGTLVALDVRDEQNDIWVWSLARETLTRVTFDAGRDRTPVWSPDGRRLAYHGGPNGNGTLQWRLADGSGTVEALTDGRGTFFPTSFTPDGAQIIVLQQDLEDDPVADVVMVPVAGDRTVTPLVQTPFSERNGEVSPDGRWLAYESDESGEYEVYVRPFPDTDSGGKWQVSPGGGTRPVWSADGTELFYLIPPGRVMSVPVELAGTFSYGSAAEVFDGRYVAGNFLRTYDVSADGQRFLMIKDAAPDDTNVAQPPEVVIVLNWFEELKRLVPTE